MPFNLGIKDIIDILLVALMLYYIFKLMRESRSLNIFYGVPLYSFLSGFSLVECADETAPGSILDKFVSVGVIAIVILFQEEIRKFLYSLGAQKQFKSFSHWFSSSSSQSKRRQESHDADYCLLAWTCLRKGRRADSYQTRDKVRRHHRFGRKD